MAVASLRETSVTQWVYPLADPLALDRCGGKAWHLRRMLELKLPVPPGLVITSEALETFLERNDLREPIDELLRQAAQTQPASLPFVSQKIPELIEAANI